MTVAVSKRPVEAFDTNVTLPEWQLEPDEEAYLDMPLDGEVAAPDAAAAPVEPDMEPAIAAPPAAPAARDSGNQKLDKAWLDDVLRRPGSAAPR
jgi:penicillin-binding protein 1A